MSEQVQRPRILFVDDEPAVLDGLRRVLAAQARIWDMSFETDPLRARARALENTFQVIVSDLRMPGLGGLELIAQLKQAGCPSVCLVLTGTGDMEAALDAINRGGVFRFFTKPCSAETVRQGIADALAVVASRNGHGLALAALNRMPFAAFALDRGFKVLFTNRAGSDLLKAGTVMRTDGGGTVRATTVAETAILHQTVGATATDGESRVVALTDGDDCRYSALIEAASDVGDGAAVLLFLREMDQCRVPAAAVLEKLFALNPSEARLAHALASGFDIREAAEAQGVTLSTARTYLKRLFQKTGANRQAELVRMLLGAVPGL